MGVVEGYFTLRGGEFTNAGDASQEIKAVLQRLGASQDNIKRAAVSAFEAEMNVIIHAVAGILRYAIEDGAVRITVTDMGPGIADIGLAMREGYSTAPEWAKEMGWGSGLGLPNIERNSDGLRIDSVVGEGTTLEILIRYADGGAHPQKADEPGRVCRED